MAFDGAEEKVTAEVIRNENAQSVFVRYPAQVDDGGITTTEESDTVADGEGVTGTYTVSEGELCGDDASTGSTTYDSSDNLHNATAELVANVGETKNEQVVESVEFDVDCNNMTP